MVPGQFSTQALAVAIGVHEKEVAEVLAGKVMTEEFVMHLVELQPCLKTYRDIICDVTKEEWLAWSNELADMSQVLPNNIVVDFEDIQPITTSSEFLPWLFEQQGVSLNACLKAMSNLTSNKVLVMKALTDAGYYSRRSRINNEQISVWWWNPLYWCVDWGGHAYLKRSAPTPKPPSERKQRIKANFYEFYFDQIVKWLHLKKAFNWIEVQNTFVRPYITEKTNRELAIKAIILDSGFDYNRKAKMWSKYGKTEIV